MVDQWIRKGEINIDQLKDRQKEALLKWREKEKIRRLEVIFISRVLKHLFDPV